MRILIVRFSSIGDIVLCTPVFRWIKQNYPNAELHFLTKGKFKQVVNGNPYIDHLIEWENRTQRSEMFETDYDFLVDLHNNLRSRMVKLRLWSVPNRSLPKQNLQKIALVLSSKGSWGKWILGSSWIRRILFDFSGDVNSSTKGIDRTDVYWGDGSNSVGNKPAVSNIVTRNLSLLTHLGLDLENLQNADRFLDFFIENPKTSIELPEKFVALVLGGTYATKQMPLELLESIINKVNSRVVLLGGPNESKLSEQLMLQFPDKLLNFCGQLNLNDSAWLAKQSQVVLSGDTGMAHIAAALGCNLVMIWGNTVPEFGMSPPVRNTANVHHFNVLDLDCRPCSKLGYSECPQKHFRCMKNQDIDGISAVVENYL